jgi:hypothetical protein
LVYEFNSAYPTLIFFKLTDGGALNNPSFSCAASILSSDLTIHIPDLLLQDGTTHLWVDLEYDTALSAAGNAYYYIRSYGTPTPTGCTATIDGNLLLHIPYLSYVSPSGTLSFWADLVYEYNPLYPTLIPFKLKNYDIISYPSFLCAAATLSSDLTIQITDVLLPDGSTHLWADLVYSAALSTKENAYFLVANYGMFALPK